MLKILFSKLGKKQSPYVLQGSKREKFIDEKTGLFRYVRNDIFSHKKDESGKLTRGYYTGLVANDASYEDATNNAISFRFDVNNEKHLIERNSVSKTHYNLGYNEKNGTHTGAMEWEFEDGSSITEIITFTGGGV